MRHVKLYENWINESASSDIPQVLDEALKILQTKSNSSLNNISKYGELGNQIRSYISDYRSKYLSSSVWSSVNTKGGLEKSLGDFKELYRIAFDGYDLTSPLWDLLGGIYSQGITDKIMNSKKAVQVGNTVKFGDDKLAKTIGCSVILSQLSVVITKGLYYYSANVPFKFRNIAWLQDASRYSNLENVKNLQDYLDLHASDDPNWLFDLGAKKFKRYQMETTGYTPFSIGTHGGTMLIPREEQKSYFSWSKVLELVEKLSLDNILSDFIEAQTVNTRFTSDGIENLYAVLYAGNQISEELQENLKTLTDFMEKGGPSWYQKLIG